MKKPTHPNIATLLLIIATIVETLFMAYLLMLLFAGEATPFRYGLI